VFGSETSKYPFTVMNLIDEGIMSRIQNNLAEARSLRTSYGALWFNTLMFLGVLLIAYLFLTAQYHSTKQIVEPVNIPKKELFWNNSIRNSLEH
jgi:hypothetical protein